jgi:hypothetical protein
METHYYIYIIFANCIKRSPLRQGKSGHIRQVTSEKRGSIYMKLSMTGEDKDDL